MKWLVALLSLAAVAWATAPQTPASAAVDTGPAWPEAVVRVADLGRTFAACDIAWLKTVQVMGSAEAAKQKYPHLEDWIDLVTALDPKLVVAYTYGAILLVTETARAPRVDALLERGERALPEEFMLSMDRGFVAYFGELDAGKAADHYARAATKAFAPPYLKQFSERLRKQGEDCRSMRDNLAALAASSDSKQRAAMESQLRPIIENCTRLHIDAVARKYRLDRNTKAHGVDELIEAGVLKAEDIYTPPGKCWLFDYEHEHASIGDCPPPDALAPAAAGHTMTSSAIELRGLGKTVSVGFLGRKKMLLEGVSFDVAARSVSGFVGPNGAGKSTTIKHIIGGARPTTGTVRVFGGDPREASVRKRFGYMPELPFLPPTLTPREMMKLHATLCGVVAGDFTKRSGALLERVDLLAKADDKVGTFSKGMQTRLSLALALLHDPDLLILDEPMSGLDPVGRQLVRELLREQAHAGKTIFFSSHVLADVEALCDAVVVIRDGRVVYAGSAGAAVGTTVGAWTARVSLADPAKLGALSVRKEGDSYVVVVAGADAVDVAVKLKSAGAAVLSIEPQRASLEERMVELLGKSAS